MGSKWVGKGRSSRPAKAKSSLLHVDFYLVKLPPNQGQRSVMRWEGEKEREQGGRQCELRGDGGLRSGERKGDVLIVDGSGADSCNDLICLCAWRWKDRTPPERIAPSFSVNRVNYLYNEICKVVNFSSSLFLPSQLFTLPNTFLVLSSFPPLVLPVTPHPPIAQKLICLLHLLHQLTSLVHILRVAQSCFHIFFLTPDPPHIAAPSSFSFFLSTPLPLVCSTSLIAVLALSLF